MSPPGRPRHFRDSERTPSEDDSDSLAADGRSVAEHSKTSAARTGFVIALLHDFLLVEAAPEGVDAIKELRHVLKLG